MTSPESAPDTKSTTSDESKPALSKFRAEHLLWLPALVALLIYLPTLGHEGVIDDRLLILENPNLSAFGGIHEIWTHDLWEASALHSSTQYYRPLPMTLYWLQILLFGPKLWWLRLGNVLIFASAAALLPRLLLRTNPKLGIPLATLISLAWALHPLNSEVVIWLSGRFDALVLLLAMGTLFVNTEQRRRRLVPIFLALALLTKEVGIVLMPAILLGDIVQCGGIRPALKSEGQKWALMALVVGAYLVLRRVLGIYGATDVLFGIAPAVFLSGLADLSLTYIRLTFAPLGLDVHHWSVTWPLAVGIGVLLTHLALCVFAWVVARKRKAGILVTASIMASLSLILASNVGPSQHVFGDRFWSLVGVSLAVFLAEAIEKRAPLRPLWRNLWIGACVVLGMLTVLRGTDWASEERLAERTLAQEPDHPHWLVISVNHLLRRGEIDEARVRIQRVLQLEPNMAKAHNAACVIALRSNRLEQAELECRRATQLSPETASMWVNLASVYVNAKRYEETKKTAEKALSLQLKNAEAEYLMAVAEANLGAFEEAAKHAQRGLSIAPNHPGLRKLKTQLESRTQPQ